MSWIGVAIIGSSLVSGYMGSKAAKDAARMTADATVQAARIQQEMYEQGREDLAPYRELGYTALSDIEGRLPFLTSQFGEEQLRQYLDPSMDFRRKLGEQSTARMLNVGGGAISGNTLRGLEEFGQGLASTEYGNAFNRAQTERGNIYNTLANIAGMGQGAVNTGVGMGTTTAQNLGTLGVGGAQAQAAGMVGSANAISNALQGPSNYLQLQALMGRNPFAPNPAVASPGGPTQAYAPQAVQTSFA
jgi:hypothetical protein